MHRKLVAVITVISFAAGASSIAKESPASFMLERLDSVQALAAAATAAAHKFAADPTAPPACRDSAAQWLDIQFDLPASTARDDQKLSLVGNVWLPCIKASIADLVLEGVPLSHMDTLRFASTAFVKTIRAKQLDVDKLKRAALDLGTSLNAVFASASDRSVVRAVLSSIFEPLVRVLRDPTQVDRLVRDFISAPPPGMELSYWKFVPPLAGHIAQQAFSSLTFKSRCFNSVSVSSSVKVPNEKLDVTVTATQQTSAWCLETLLFWTGGSFALDLALWEQLFHTQEMTIKGKNAAMHAAQWSDATTNGVRVFYSMEPLLDTIASLLETTAFYFGPIVTDSGELSALTELEAALMTNTYLPLPLSMQQPAPASASAFNAASFAASLSSGDVLMTTRLDGVDALFNWAQAETAGSLAIAVCPSETRCLVCESRAESSYWLTANGVQCHDAAAWFTLASNVSLNVVKLPLRDDLRAKFDTTSAYTFARDKLEIDYAYQNWAFAWLDTLHSNFPCFPYNNFTRCMTFDHIEVLLVTVDNILPAVSAYFFGEGLNNRLSPDKGQQGATVIESLQWALTNKNLTAMQVVVMPEQDTWPYYATRNGEIYNGTIYSSSNFVCNVLRTGGLWTTPFECSEATNFDVYSFDIYNASATQQVLGDYAVWPQPQFNSRKLYADMGNGCASAPPTFLRPDLC